MPNDSQEPRTLEERVEQLELRVRRIEKALGTLCLGFDDSVHVTDSKLKGIEPNTPDAFYMLAAFCFDLQRKSGYHYLATRDFVEHADHDLARELWKDHQELYRHDRSWERTARDAEEILLRLLRQVFEEHARLLREAAR